MNFPDAYCIFDFETTGLDPERDQITEAAWQVWRNGVPGRLHSYLNSDVTDIPDEVQAITGITPELCATGRSLAAILENFMLSAGNLPLVGHNVVRFDALFLEAAFERLRHAGRPWIMLAPKRSRYLDTAALYKARKLRIPDTGADHWAWASALLEKRVYGLKYNLQAACADFGIPWEGVAHRAGGDVAMTAKLFQALTGAGVTA